MVGLTPARSENSLIPDQTSPWSVRYSPELASEQATAQWAADKFNAETIAAAVEKSGLAEKVKHRKLTLPGHVAVISGGLEEASGWNVDVGPKEAVGLTSYLKQRWKAE